MVLKFKKDYEAIAEEIGTRQVSKVASKVGKLMQKIRNAQFEISKEDRELEQILFNGQQDADFWRVEEKDQFISLMRKFGKDWTAISEEIGTKSAD